MGRVGVLLLNLGPDRLEDVGPFLFNLFSDPEIIRIPFLFAKTPSVVHFPRRTKTSQENYRQIGGGSGKSPKRKLTPSEEQLQQKDKKPFMWNALLASVHRRSDRQN